MALFDNGYLEEFLLFLLNFNITLLASGMPTIDAKVQYLCIIVRGEALCQFDILYADFESSTPLTLEAIFWYWVRTFSC